MINLKNLTIIKAHQHLVNGDFSARELAEAYVKEIEARNPSVNAYLEVFDDVQKQAETADKRIKKDGKNAPLLCGSPLAVKDNILIAGHIASCASKSLENYRAAYDATVVEKLKGAGAVFLGRANMDEFAMGSSTEHSAFGVVRNPLDETRSPGGSSGGPAAAVAMGGAAAALGSDTGGSIRQPASFTGVVGLKPTYGAVSRYGLVAMASSLDQIGPLAKTVEDARILFEAISGHDPRDSTSLSRQSSVISHQSSETKKMTIGVPYHLFEGGIDKDVLENFNAAIEKFKDAGYEIKEIELPHAKYALPVYYIVMPAEASTNLARFDGVRYGLHKSGENLFADYTETRGAGFGEEVRRRILTGTYVLSAGYYDAYYTQARAVRERIRKDFLDAFEGVDCIATPTSPTPAFKLGEKTGDPLAMYLADIFTVPANIAGIPALSVPSGTVERDKTALPVGLQLMAGHGGENILFEVGEQFEKLMTDD